MGAIHDAVPHRILTRKREKCENAKEKKSTTEAQRTQRGTQNRRREK
jgi:hypothetical protein